LQLIDKVGIVQFYMVKRIPGSLFLRNLVERRSLLFQLVRRDFEQRFVGSAIGWIWGLIHPLVLLVSWVFVFQICLKGNDVPNYPFFLFAGMLPWLLFSETVNRSATSLLEQANLITKTVFPAEVVPVSVFLSALLSHLLALALMLIASAVWLHNLSPWVALLPVYMLATGLLAVGLGWVVASLHVFVRDTAQVLNVVMTFWFWFTPIFFPEQKFPSWAHRLLFLNPVVYLVRGYRTILIEATAPNPLELAQALAFAGLVFVCGGLFFRYMKRGFADVL
jgi:lipopolysaccharide transport system permease protein